MNAERMRAMAALAVVVTMAATATVHAGGRSDVVAKADLVWKSMGSAGIESASVSGDMEKGPCRFFLKYPVGLVTPNHFHSSDHYVTVVSGTIVLRTDGKEHRLGPGSYFALLGKAAHEVTVEGDEPAVFFIQAEGPWDVVMAGN